MKKKKKKLKKKKKSEKESSSDDSDDESDFIRVKKKKKKEKKKDGKKDKKTHDEESDKHCKYFLKGSCRHGFLGKKSYEGVEKCKYVHPMVCKKFMNYGKAKDFGCQGECDLVHVTMCKESLNGKECTKIGDRKRCPYGYHIKDKRTPEKSSEVVTRTEKKSDNLDLNRDSLRSFFGEIMRQETVRLENRMEEMVNLRMSQIQPSVVRETPPVRENQSREREFFSLMKDMMSQY